jgi:uncharacterized protein (DUF305 family)
MKFRLATTLFISNLICATPAVAVAQMAQMAQMAPTGPMVPMPMPNAVTTATPPPPNTPSTAAYIEANEKMHRAMDIRYSGKPSLDFLTAMIPHHRGAIEMAQIALRYSTDRQTRRLAQKIIAAQEAEITQMRALALRLQR